MARIEHSIEVHAAPEAVYERLLRFDEYPSFMQDVRQVRRIGLTGLQWEVGHGEGARSWQAEITEQSPGRRLAWRHTHGPRHEAAFELEAVPFTELATGLTTPLTRLRLILDCELPEQGYVQPADAERALRERVTLDLTRLKKHIEQRAAAQAAAPEARAPEGLGRTIRMGESAEPEDAASQAAHGRRAMPWKRHAPTLPELWELWQQPLRVARRVSHEVERVVGSVRGRAAGETATSTRPEQGGAWTPAVETAQRERKFVVRAELPGLKCEDVQVEIKHDRVTISGERRPEAREAREERHSERRYGPFYRVITLPPGALPEQACARMQDGVLEITVPLAEFATRPRRLDVRPSEGMSGP